MYLANDVIALKSLMRQANWQLLELKALEVRHLHPIILLYYPDFKHLIYNNL